MRRPTDQELHDLATLCFFIAGVCFALAAAAMMIWVLAA